VLSLNGTGAPPRCHCPQNTEVAALCGAFGAKAFSRCMVGEGCGEEASPPTSSFRATKNKLRFSVGLGEGAPEIELVLT
jgi:hypothetical protein